MSKKDRLLSIFLKINGLARSFILLNDKTLRFDFVFRNHSSGAIGNF